MNHLNNMILEGNIVADPVLKEISNGDSLCTFKVATDRFYKKSNHDVEKEVSFFDIQAWGKLAETIGKYGSKGRGVRIVGRLKQDRWEGPDGNPRSKVIIVAENVELRKEQAKEEVKEEAIEKNESPE